MSLQQFSFLTKMLLLSNSRLNTGLQQVTLFFLTLFKGLLLRKQSLNIILILFNSSRIFCNRFLKAILFSIAIKLIFTFSTIACVLKALRVFRIYNVLEVIFDAMKILRIDKIAISEHQINLTFTIRGTSVGHDDNITYRRNVTIIGSGTR